jgi:uncharacterized protein YbjT (DUF2867 family)
MSTQSGCKSPILVTGAAGAVGSIGRNLTQMLLARGRKVRALVRREDERAEALRRLGAEVMQGDLLDLTSVHRGIEGCERVYFGMSLFDTPMDAQAAAKFISRYDLQEARPFRPTEITKYDSVLT